MDLISGIIIFVGIDLDIGVATTDISQFTVTEVYMGNITKVIDVQVIVNEDNTHLLGGGGVEEVEFLTDCYYNSMRLTMENRIKIIASPSISAGIYHFPVEQATKIVVNNGKHFLDDNEGIFDWAEWVLFEYVEMVYETEVDKL